MDALLIATQDMNDNLNQPHPDVTFSKIGDDTITALTTLSSIFTKKINNTPVKTTTMSQKAP